MRPRLPCWVGGAVCLVTSGMRRLARQQPVASANRGRYVGEHCTWLQSLSSNQLFASDLELAGTACEAAQHQLPASACWLHRGLLLDWPEISVAYKIYTYFSLSGAEVCSAAELCSSIGDAVAQTAQPCVARWRLVNYCLPTSSRLLQSCAAAAPSWQMGRTFSSWAVGGGPCACTQLPSTLAARSQLSPTAKPRRSSLTSSASSEASRT